MDEVHLTFNAKDGNKSVIYSGKTFGWSQPKQGICSDPPLPGPKCDFCYRWTLNGALKKIAGP